MPESDGFFYAVTRMNFSSTYLRKSAVEVKQRNPALVAAVTMLAGSFSTSATGSLNPV